MNKKEDWQTRLRQRLRAERLEMEWRIERGYCPSRVQRRHYKRLQENKQNIT